MPSKKPPSSRPPSLQELVRHRMRVWHRSNAWLGRKMVPPVSRQRVTDVITGGRPASRSWWLRAAAALGIAAEEEPAIAAAPPADRNELVLLVEGGGLRGPLRAAPVDDQARELFAALASPSWATSVAVDGPEWLCLVRRAAVEGVDLVLRPATPARRARR